jgi:hypothetical protein
MAKSDWERVTDVTLENFYRFIIVVVVVVVVVVVEEFNLTSLDRHRTGRQLL